MLDSLNFLDRELPWFFPTASLVFGAIVGSFLNVCIYRIPEKRSIITPGSTCACGKAIAWYDNIPILSWFILRGRSRCCDQPYSFRYPFVEILTGSIFYLAWQAHDPAKALCIMLFAALLICASFIDLDHMEIPNRFSIGLAVVGFFVSVFVPSLHPYPNDWLVPHGIASGVQSAIGTLIGSGVILWIALLAESVLRKEAMGFGDVKLLGGIGAFIGWKGAVFAIFGGATLGCVALLLWLVLKSIFPKLKSEEKTDEDGQIIGRHIPFGPMLSAGALVYTLFLEDSVNRYFQNTILYLF